MDNTQNIQQQNQQDPEEPQLVSTGSIEAGPAVDMSAEEAPAQAEYGHEAIRKLEASTESAIEAAERKEGKRMEDPKQKQAQKQDGELIEPVTPQVKVQTPKYFGYNIPTDLASNTRVVSQKKGTGDPASSRTWLFVLLDRMLRIKAS